MTNKISLILFFVFSIAFGQVPTIAWQKTFGGSSVENVETIIAVPSGGYLIAGDHQSRDGDLTAPLGGMDGLLVKISDEGIVEWHKLAGGINNEYFVDVKSTQDGGFIAVGGSTLIGGDVIENHGDQDAWVVKFANDRSIQWTRSFGGSGYDRANSVLQTSDGGYLVATSTNSGNGDVVGFKGGNDIWLLKISATGALEWQKTYGGSNTDSIMRMIHANDGGYMLLGITNSTNGDISGLHGSLDPWVIKISTEGVIQWQKTFGGSAYDNLLNIKPTADGYVMAGASNSTNGDVTTNKGSGDIWIVRISNSGALVWQKTYGGMNNDYGVSIECTQDGGYLALCTSGSKDGDILNNYGEDDIVALQLNADGNLVWQKNFGGTSQENAAQLLQDNKGDFVFAGDTYSNDTDVTGNHGLEDVWFVKLTPSALEAPSFDVADFDLYPNPVKNHLGIQNSNLQPIDSIAIYDVFGKLLFSSSISNQKIHVENFQSGIYFLEITSNSNKVVKKFLKG